MPAGRWTLYIVRCRDGSLYVGIAIDLAARLAAHNAGRGAKYTRSRRPVALVWSRSRQGPTDARRREYALKRLSRAAKLALVAGDDNVWRRILSAERARPDDRVRSVSPARDRARPRRHRSAR